MSTTKQKQAARKNLEKARTSKSGATKKSGTKKRTQRQLSTADKNRLSKRDFAFPDERKEPLVDARHVRNAIARFDQVEDVTDAERDRAWKRILAAAKRFDVEPRPSAFLEISGDGKATKKKASKKKATKKETTTTKRK